MARKAREFYRGALYHIIQRGNNRSYIYDDIRDKQMFFEFLKQARNEYDFNILYYTLMDNHYHLVIEAGDIPISRAMRSINLSYSKYYNRKYNRTGSIYGGRYTAYVIKDTGYYYQVLRYIAGNPVKAGLCKVPREYRWSAHREICKDRSRIVNINKTLSYFPGSGSTPKLSYMKLIENGDEAILDYGKIPIKEAAKTENALAYLIANMDIRDDIRQRLVDGDKSVDIKKERDLFIKSAHLAGFSPKDIANYISFSAEGVRRILRK